MADVQMPELGENITQGTVTQWFKRVGESAITGEALFEVSTDKVDAEVPSPISGTITEILANVGDVVAIGGVVAKVDTGASSTPTAAPAPAPEVVATDADVPASPSTTSVPVAAAPAPPSSQEITTPNPAPSVPAAPVLTTPQPAVQRADVVESRLVTSPVVRKLINELGTDAGLVTGTGPEGRITRKDAERIAFSPDHLASTKARLESSSRTLTSSLPAPPPAPAGANFIAFNKIRKITGERMVTSKVISPHVMTVVEVDYERIDTVRRSMQESWKKEEGFTLTYLPFVARALVQALNEFPQMNASLAEGGLVLHDHVNLSVAVDINFEGLLAPVLRQVEDRRIGAIARDIADVASRARNAKLRPDELSGGTFTISNSGPFGTFMVAPVINQPQVAILSTDGVTRKPVVVTDSEGGESIAIHSVGMLVLSWDHRAFDGAYAAAFMRRLKDVLEHHDWVGEF
jgi:pyruvate dehydrogenase E2 component (dihydrolipoamide acetyltransferase)